MTTANLIDDRQLTARLLASPLDWRVRVVEEVSVDAASSCLRRRSLQVAPLRSHLQGSVADDDTHALIGLYVAPIPRGPLLDFDVSGPEGECWLLPRVEIAERQALYLAELAKSAGQPFPQDLHQLLRAICGFTGELIPSDGFGSVSLDDYLEAGIGSPVGQPSLNRWRAIGETCRQVLRPRLDVFRGYSAPENPALVLPELIVGSVFADLEEATVCLEAYEELIVALDAAARLDSSSPAAEFLDVVADYANNYDCMVALRVPLDEPFIIKIADRRDLRLSLFRNAGEQELVIADAQTNHVTFKVQDPNVRIAAFKARRPGSNAFSFGAFQSRKDQQNRSFYAHDPDRDYRIRLTFRLGLLRRLQLVPYFVALMLALVTAALLKEQPTDLRTLAVVAGPAALAASVLLAREPSTLGSRLRLASSLAVVTALFCLVSVSVGLFISGLDDSPVDPSLPPDTATPAG